MQASVVRVREDQKPPPQDQKPPPQDARRSNQNVCPQHMMHVPWQSDLQADLEMVGCLVGWLLGCFIYKRG